MKTKPYNRHETFLAALSDSSITVPTPLSREELYLSKIAGESVTIPAAPYNRYETYLAKLAGDNVTVPMPASRLEAFLYKACGYDVQVPIPANREEIFWKRYIGENSIGESVTIMDAEAVPMKNLTVEIRFVQSGTGTPSQENQRPLHGWTSVDVRRTAKNLWGGDAVISDVSSAIASSIKDPTANTIQYSSYMSASNSFLGSFTLDSVPKAINFKKDQKYTFVVSALSSQGQQANLILKYTSGALYPVGFIANEKTAVLFTNEKDIQYFGKATYKGYTIIYADECGLYEGVIALTDHVPYVGKTYTIDVSGAGTVYGGTLDVINGLLTVTHGYIESYNNEDLPGEWTSSIDVYVPGTKPTVGAQVVYKMEEDDWEMYQLQPVEVVALEGLNKIWSVCGPVSVTYIPDL